MTTTKSVQDLSKIGIDFTEHYPQYLPKKGVWEVWTYNPGSTPRPASPVYIWLDRDVLILVDNEQWANDLCAAGYKVGLIVPKTDVAPAKPVLKPQHLMDYAFKVGTLCSPAAEAPDWKPFVHKLMPPGYCCGVNGNDLDHAFDLGKKCKPGVRYREVSSLV